MNACKQRLIDLERAKQLISPSVCEALEAAHKQLIRGFKADIENINLRCEIWESGLMHKLRYLISAERNLPDKHQSFYYRIKTFIASFKWTQSILKTKKTAKYDKVLKQDEPIRSIKTQDLLNPEIGLLIYL